MVASIGSAGSMAGTAAAEAHRHCCKDRCVVACIAFRACLTWNDNRGGGIAQR